jgi:glycosyltransferase involved in cell wall biosynthesis
MRVIAWGTYDVTKPRTRILLAAMRAAGLDVDEIHADVWAGVRDKSLLTRAQQAAVVARMALRYAGLAARYARAPKADAVFVGYLGQLDVLLVKPLALLRNEPVVWDAFLSLYDTVVDDRRMVRAGGIAAKVLHAWESLAFRAADVVLLDTDAHAHFFADEFGRGARDDVASIFVGAEPAFAPRPRSESDDARATVLFWGQFIPLHGIDAILDAARASDAKRFRFVIVGDGQEAPRIRARLAREPIANLEWIPWIDYEALPDEVAKADVCLGIFGASDKAARVIPNKVFQILAAGKPVITRDSPAIRELLGDDDDGVYLVPAMDGAAIVAALERWHSERARLREPLHRAIVERFSESALAAAFTRVVERIGARRRR